jgi:hypothetical protein
VALAGGGAHGVALRVDHHQRRPGAHAVLLPRLHFRVVEHRMTDAVAAHRPLDGGVVGLVGELGRMHTDDHEAVTEGSSSGRSSSMMCRQLMQQKVQKSSSTTLPRRPAMVSGRSVLIHPAPRSSGARTRGMVADFMVGS